jgi:hypothetical protein
MIKAYANGQEIRLAEQNDHHKRLIFDDERHANNEAAFWRAIHPDAEIVVVQVTDDLPEARAK